MILCRVIDRNTGSERAVVINQKHISSFEAANIGDRQAVELRMSNGDTWYVVDPSISSWMQDAYTTDTGY